MKKILSLSLSFVMLASITFGLNFTADAATIIKTFSGSIEYYDYIDESFSISNEKLKITISLNTDKPVDFSVCDDEFNDIICVYDVTSYSKTVTLSKGTYNIMLNGDYYYDYDDDYYYDYDDIYCNYSIKVTDVTKYSSSIKLKTTSKKLSVGSSTTLKYTLGPSGSIAKSLSWSSSNNKVATVNKSGKVVAKGLGKCTITAKLNNGKTSKCTITVNNKSIYIFTGTTRSLPTINGSKKVKWKSKNKGIATVTGQKVKGKKQGKTTVESKYKDVTYKVSVYAVNYNNLLSATKSKLKDMLKDPSSLKVYHIWRGYDSDGDPTIVLDYGAKNSYGAMVRDDYCIGYYHYDSKKGKFVCKIYFSENIPKLTSKKKLK